MKKRLLIVSSILGSIGVAQAETVNFNGTVSTSCAFSSPTTGTLVAYAQGSDYNLDSGFNGGTPATLALAYTGAPTFSVSAVNSINSSTSLPTITSITTGVSFGVSANESSALSAGANSFTSGSKTFSLDSGSNSDTVSVKTLATASNPFPVGTYTAQTTVTCQ